MQPDQPQKPESAPSGSKTSSFARFIKSKYTITKSNTPPKRGYRGAYFRPQRHHNPTEADLKHNVGTLQIALENTWARRHHSRYRKAHALLVCWPDSDLTAHAADPYPSMRSLGSESNETPMSFNINTRNSSSTILRGSRPAPFVSAAYHLSSVLERRYGISAQVWKIPSLETQLDMLKAKIRQFVDEYGGPDSLLIFWYGGNAKLVNAALNPFGDGIAGQVIWYGLEDEPGISAKIVMKMLSLARADVLILNDSPFAQYTYMSNINGPGLFELLGSGCTETDPATAASFTQHIAQQLNSPQIAARGISVTELHRRLLDITAVPVTCATAPASAPGPALVLDPVPAPAPIAPGPATQAVKIPAYPVYLQLAQLAHNEGRNIVLSRLDASLAAETSYVSKVKDPGVRVHFRLARPHLDVQLWKEWILNAPVEAEEVSVKVALE
ncbi:hypothetical protein F5Y09DRAFT_353100 [Xylaria sp. FL1042]|nr:hypothetical protein F5Y09DRAFT_353100 [Xylaria sp. FL1042]